MISGPRYPLHATLEGRAGDERTIVVRYRSAAALVINEFGLVPHVELGYDASSARIAEAARVATDADLALVITGRVSGETMEVDDLRLPGDQESLITAVAAANPRTVVVTASANPVIAPWREQVAGIIHMWQPGECFGPALATVVSGAAEPGGRLPVTVPESVESIAIAETTDESRLDYREGTLVGYRGYDAAGLTPAYWFGHGLGYAEIDIEVITVDSSAAHVRLTCGIGRGGKAVVQLYARTEDASAAVFCGWQVARLAAGETRDVVVPIDHEALARWDAAGEELVVPRGPTELLIGRSRGDIVGSHTINLIGGPLAKRVEH